MDKGALEAIQANVSEPMLVGGRMFLPNTWAEAKLPPQATVEPIRVSTLTAIRDYLAANVDDLESGRLIVHVASAERVVVYGALEDEAEQYRRPMYMIAEPILPRLRFGEYLDSEAFHIALHACYVSTEERAALLAVLSSIRDSDVRETGDDGISQQVKVARGITFVDNAKVPNPVSLAPYRTFPEVAQPTSSFVLRLQGGGERPRVALFEADGGKWRLEAMANVAAWLVLELKTGAIVS